MLPKSLPKEQRNEMYRLISLFAGNGPHFHKEIDLGDPELTARAMLYLQDLGFMEYRRSVDYTFARLTPRGYEQWEQINSFTPWYWLKRNKLATFTAVIASIALLFSGVAATTGVIGLLG